MLIFHTKIGAFLLVSISLNLSSFTKAFMGFLHPHQGDTLCLNLNVSLWWECFRYLMYRFEKSHNHSREGTRKIKNADGMASIM